MTNRMALRHIEAFNSVIRMGTMTGAAVALHTSQPQISRLIGQLEAIVQFKLFERNGSRLKPTLEGLRFHNEVRKTFDGLTTLEAAATNIRAFGTQRLSVAAMPRLAGGPMARAVASFKLAHPRVLVAIHSGDAQAVHRWVHSGFCDAGLAMLYDEEADAQDLQVEVLHRANFVVVLHSDGTTGEYFHLERGSARVHAGDRVERGQPLARSGNTGFSTAPHLHFGVYRTGHDRTTDSLAVRFQTRRGALSNPRSGAYYLNPLD